MTKILIPAYSFYPAQEGGPSNALYWLACGLASIGYEVRVVTTNRFLPEGSAVTDQWVALNGFKVIYQSNWADKTLLYKEVDNCDILFTNGVCKISNYLEVLRALKHNKKVVLSPRGEIFESAIDHKGVFYGFMKRCFFFLMRLTYGSHVYYHGTSDEEVSAIKKYFGLKARVSLIPNYMILPSKIGANQIAYEKKYLLYVGRVNHIKNLDILIAGLAKSPVFLSSNMTLKIAGETGGDYYKSLIKQINELGLKDKVEFLGLVTGQEKDILYANAKCLLLLSKSENFGNVIVEALAQGTPVIASKGTPWEKLDETGAGHWIDAKDEVVGKSLDDLLSLTDEDYSAMRANAYQLSKEFDIYENVGKWNRLINDL